MTINGDFTPEQKRYLEGFTSGVQTARAGRGMKPLGGHGGNGNAVPIPAAPLAPVAEPSGPDAAHHRARNRFVAQGRKLVAEETAKAMSIYVQASHAFALPSDPAKPIVMVGPGTGVAPFRAFLHERRAVGATGRSWLFFGHQRRACDFFYEDEFADLATAGTLTRLTTAFSRDQQQKVYVQDRMVEEGAELFRWLQDGAYFYVCGDAKRMAADVDRALHRVVAAHGGMDEAGARSYVAGLVKSGRCLRDVY